MSKSENKKVDSYAIIGFGNIGQALARAFARNGIEVSVATTRDPESFSSAAAAIGPTIIPKTLAEAVKADIIFLAVRFESHRDVAKALPLMSKGGSIILTGSSAGSTGAPAFTAYSASKAAVRNLARTWAEDLKGTGIRVNVLSPGATATELAKEALGEEGLKAYGSMTALQRMGDPAEVGAAAAFLASSDSSFMTASEVAVDGGLAQL